MSFFVSITVSYFILTNSGFGMIGVVFPYDLILFKMFYIYYYLMLSVLGSLASKLLPKLITWGSKKLRGNAGLGRGVMSKLVKGM